MKSQFIRMSMLSLIIAVLCLNNAMTHPSYALSDTLPEIQPQDTIDWLVEQAEDDTLEHNRVIQHVDENGDTTYITLGKKRIRIIEEDDETSLKIEKLDRDEEYDDDFYGEHNEWTKPDWQDFKGHWAGFEFGLNNYVNANGSFVRDETNRFMHIHTGKSWNFNLNFAQYSLGFGSNRVGMITGMGLEWNNYHFRYDNSIEKADGEIVPRPIPETTFKNRLQTTYLTVPLLIEYQFPGKSRKDRFYLSGGVIGGFRLFSNTRIHYTMDGSKKKTKEKGDYYLSTARYGFTLRAGYKWAKFFANYYMTPLFLSGRGPELYPVAAGMVISF